MTEVSSDEVYAEVKRMRLELKSIEKSLDILEKRLKQNFEKKEDT